MRNKRRIKKVKKGFIYTAICLLICSAIIGGLSIKNKYFGKQIVEAVNVGDTLSMMNEHNPVNLALKDKINLINVEKAELQLEAKRDEIKAEISANEKLEQDMENQRIEDAKANGKIAYLTFDDGPSLVSTPKILDILEEYDIKATFFVIGYMAEKHPEILRMVHEKGHTIGNHSYSHNYGYIYRNVTNFMDDINKTNVVLKDILGDEFSTNIIRFPGGSFGKDNFIKRVQKEGLHYFDWNSLNGDAEGVKFSKQRLVNRFKETAKNKKKLIVLMHDTDAKSTTVEALPEIIEYLLENGYVFDVLDNYYE